MTTTTLSFRALDFRFNLETDDPALAEYVSEVFSSLSSTGPATGVYTAASGVNGYLLRLGDHLIASSAGAERVVTLLTWHVTQQAMSAMAQCVALHAAVAVAGDGALLLPGPSGSGKSTLVAALVRRGLDYLTDELAVLSGEPPVVAPYPKPLGLAESPPPPLDDLAAAGSPFETEGRLVPVTALRDDAVGRPAPPAWIVFPSYSGGVEPALTRLRPAEGLALLGEQWINSAESGTPGFRTLARVVKDAPCWRLEAGALDATCDALLEIVAP